MSETERLYLNNPHARRLEWSGGIRCGGAAILLFAFLASGCGRQADRSDHVQLVLSTAEFEPGTTFELRFDEPMMPDSQVGQVIQRSPLQFQPSLRGRFVCTSSRSGIFTPEEPLELGREYELTLLPGLRRPDGQPVNAELRRRIRTPEFGIAGCYGRPASTNAYSDPEFQLWFNADVNATDLAIEAGFASADGRRVPATVQQGTGEDVYLDWWSGGRIRTWQERFHEQSTPELLRGRAAPAHQNSTNTIGNFLIVTPQQPLSVGRGWKLVIGPGLPSADRRLRLNEPFEAEVGDIARFRFESASVHHVIHRDPELHLEFSKRLDPALTNTFTNWVRIVPWPAELEAEVAGSALSLSGKWQRGTNYNLTLRQGFPALEAFGLGAPEVFTVEVPPVPPRLYFPAFATEQFAGGSRTFPLLAVNVDRIAVRAKLLDLATAVHALRGYSSYWRNHPGFYRPRDGYQQLDYNLVPGRTVFSEELPGTRQEDVAEKIELEWDRLLNGRKTGIVFLEAERVPTGFNPEPDLGSQALVQLTDLGLVWKSSASQERVFVFSYSTGRPLSGVRVQLDSDENESLREATTDASGLAILNTHTNATWLVAQLAGDLHAVRLQEHNIPAGGFGMPMAWDGSEEDAARRVGLFTDRDVYRPGEVVNLKAIVRDLTETGLSIPAGATATLACTDARGKQFFETNTILSALGSCAAAIRLPSGPRGSYAIKFRLGGREHYHSIAVADDEPAAFEIALETKPAYAPDEPFVVPVQARYFFGKPLARARVRWSLEAQDQPLSPDGFEDFTFVRTPVERYWGRGSGAFALSGEAQITPASNCVIRADVPLNPTAPQPRGVSLLVEVTDLNQQTLTRSAAFLEHSSAFYLGLKNFEEVLEPGQELPVEIAAVGADGKPWPEPVPVRVKLQRVEWETVRVQGAGRTVRYRSEANLTNLLEREVVVSTPTEPDRDAFHRVPVSERASQGHGATRPYRIGGFAGWRLPGFSAPGAGEYLLEATARDATGKAVASSIRFYVTDKSKLAWSYRNEAETKLVPDKALYQPGETARILVKTPISGTAWVSVESDHVLRSFTAQLEGNAPSIQIPIQTGDAPNVFVSVTVLRGAANNPHQDREPEYRVGYSQLEVEDPNARLQVEVTPGATNCLPGEPVVAEARIASATGEPVSGAEVTLYAVDEGVLSLSGYAVPDLHSMIFAPRKLAVYSGISLPFLLPEDPERLRFQNKGYLGGGGGSERVRQRFLACAFWNAALKTGRDGKVTVRFTAPDGLTRYQLIAVAHTANQFGSGHSAFSVSKPLQVEPALPRFANVTDRIQARALVLNQTDQAGEVLVTLQLDDKATASSRLARTVQVPSRGSAVVDFPVEFVETGSAKWTWRARFVDSSLTSYTDAVRSTIQVGTLLPLLREVALVRAEPGETNLLAPINPQLLSGKGAVTVTVANTRAVTLGEAVSQLLHYPYGCAEQTGSSLLPWIVLEDTPELIPFTGRDTNETATAAQAGIERFLSMQTASGGLAYWPGGREPMLWASAYGGFVLALARDAALPVPEEEFGRLTKYLSEQLRSQTGGPNPMSDRCLALYALALAGKAEPAYHTIFYQQRARLSPEDRALLALAIAAGHGDAHMTDALLQTSAPGAPDGSGAFFCLTREKAIRLLALLNCKPDDPAIHRLASDLMQSQQDSRWTTTQAHAWALLALREYLRQSEPASEPGAGTLTWAGETVGFQLDSPHAVWTHTFQLNPAEANRRLLLASSSRKPVFAQVTVESRSPSVHQAREDHGLGLQRRYDRLNDENVPERFDSLEIGDRILVTLRLAVHERARYVAVEDPLPSLLQPTQPEFKTQQLAAGSRPVWMARDEGNPWWSDFREIRADRVLFFANDVPPGNYLIRYVARVRAAGAATAPPAKTEEMYHPDLFGLTETRTLACQTTE